MTTKSLSKTHASVMNKLRNDSVHKGPEVESFEEVTIYPEAHGTREAVDLDASGPNLDGLSKDDIGRREAAAAVVVSSSSEWLTRGMLLINRSEVRRGRQSKRVLNPRVRSCALQVKAECSCR